MLKGVRLKPEQIVAKLREIEVKSHKAERLKNFTIVPPLFLLRDLWVRPCFFLRCVIQKVWLPWGLYPLNRASMLDQDLSRLPCVLKLGKLWINILDSKCNSKNQRI